MDSKTQLAQLALQRMQRGGAAANASLLMMTRIASSPSMSASLSPTLSVAARSPFRQLSPTRMSSPISASARAASGGALSPTIVPSRPRYVPSPTTPMQQHVVAPSTTPRRAASRLGMHSPTSHYTTPSATTTPVVAAEWVRHNTPHATAASITHTADTEQDAASRGLVRRRMSSKFQPHHHHQQQQQQQRVEDVAMHYQQPTQHSPTLHKQKQEQQEHKQHHNPQRRSSSSTTSNVLPQYPALQHIPKTTTTTTTTKRRNAKKKSMWLRKAEWGKSLWVFCHASAATYPQNASSDKRTATRAFVMSLPPMLPCASCGDHFYRLTTEQLPLTTRVLRNRNREFPIYFYLLHNSVRIRLHQPLFTVDEFNERYPDVAFTRAEADELMQHLQRAATRRRSSSSFTNKKQDNVDDDDDDGSVVADSNDVESDMVHMCRMYTSGSLSMTKLQQHVYHDRT